jgi:imidazolonepropionase-like amidohydrolase
MSGLILHAQPGARPFATLFSGARLIVGDGTAIERAEWLVDNGRVTAVGREATLKTPPGTVRVSLAGKTVIPALVNLHGHVGYQGAEAFVAENYTADNIVDHLRRYAYYGVGTVVSLGTDAGAAADGIRQEQLGPGRFGEAQLRHAGRGFALPNAGPAFPAMRPSPYGVTTADEARRLVRELATRGVDVVKIWVDDRNGTVPKLPPEVYGAVIEEAHAQTLKVIAHVYYLADAKALARAGIDGFAHPVRDAEVDGELVDLLKARSIFVMANMSLAERGSRPGRPAWLSDPFLSDSVDARALDRLAQALDARTPEAVERGATTFRNIERSLRRLVSAGVPVVLGSDSGIPDHFMGYTEHRELEVMAAAGMSPADVLAAATGRAAAAMGLTDVGIIARGRRANFVVLNANPLEDISRTKQIDAVYLEGVIIDRAGYRARWRRR